MCYPLGNTQVTCERLDSRLLGQVEETRVKEPAGRRRGEVQLDSGCPQSAEMRGGTGRGGEVRKRGGTGGANSATTMPPTRQVIQTGS